MSLIFDRWNDPDSEFGYGKFEPDYSPRKFIIKRLAIVDDLAIAVARRLNDTNYSYMVFKASDSFLIGSYSINSNVEPMFESPCSSIGLLILKEFIKNKKKEKISKLL